VMGGCGDYFEVADVVLAMREFRPHDVTDEARRIAAGNVAPRQREAVSRLSPFAHRVPMAESFDPSRGRRQLTIKTRGRERIEFGRANIDLRAVEQLVDASQTRAIASAIHLASTRFMNASRTLAEVLDEIDALFDARGLDELDPFHVPSHHPGNYARPRRFEIAAAINRLRTLRMEQMS
jgi:predicted ABC-class ATPase